MKKKLIEVALPLDAINKASAREKSIRHGHPSTLHLWWARRPLAAARAVIFSQMVDDSSEHPELFPTEEEQEMERQRLFERLRLTHFFFGLQKDNGWRVRIVCLGCNWEVADRIYLLGCKQDVAAGSHTRNGLQTI